MRGPDGRETARSDLLILAACAATALVALALPRTWSLAFATAVRQTVLRPVVAMHARATQDRIARFTLQGLERRDDSLALLVQQQYAIRSENTNLRALVALRARLAHPGVSADVLHRPTVTDAHMLLLDVGKSDGVQMFDPVVTGEGVIGYVTSAGAHSSSVLTWANADFAAAAVTVDGRVSGFVHPATQYNPAGPILELHGVAFRDSLALGTVLMTAGVGGTFPRGIPIGRITSVGREELGYDRVYRVIPFANPAVAPHVIVLTEPRDSVFPRDTVHRVAPGAP